MDVMLIVYIVIAAIIGAGVAWLLVRNSKKAEVQKLLDEKEGLEAETEKLKADAIALQETYSKQLKDAEMQTEKLEQQLRQMLDGKVDDVVQAQLADLDQLKEKIKSLKSKINELNDDYDDLEEQLEEEQKRSKQKGEEILQLQSQVDEGYRNNKKLSQELEEKRSELEERIKDLNLKIESLAFIQEVLSAGDVKTTAVEDLYNKVNNMADFIRNDFKDCMDKNGTSYDKKKMCEDDLERWNVTAKKSWIAGKTTIAFVGEFSAGKTSIVNRILSQDDPNVPTLPVSTKATTAIPTYIAGGESVSYRFVSPDNKLKLISENTFRRVSKEVLDQVKGVSSLIKYFVMTYKNPNLSGLSILDTPGFNSNDSEDAQRTIDVINECDALFWVFDVNAGTVNRSSISLIKEYLKKPLYVVINKIDTKPETEINKVEQLIRKTLQDEGVSVQSFIRFSGKENLETIMTPIKSVTRDTSQDAYLDNIKNLLVNAFKQINQEKDTALRSYNNKANEVNVLTTQVNTMLRNLKNNCDEAGSIPQWKKGFELFVKITDDKYEMTPGQHSRFVSLLGNIKNQAEDMKVLSDRRNEAAKSMQNLYEAYATKRALSQRTEACLDVFMRLSNKLGKKEI